MRKSQSQEGVEKKSIFETPFFRLWLVLGALEGSKVRSLLSLFRFFSDPGGYFFARRPFFAILMDFGVLGAIF